MTRRLHMIHAVQLTVLVVSAGSVSKAEAGIARDVAALPDIAAPSGGHAVWIARAMRLNGMPLTLKSFESAMNADESLQYYERRLRTGAVQTKRSRDGDWQTLSVFSPSYFVTIRVRDAARGAQGTIAVSPVTDKPRASTATAFPHPDTARVVNLQQYEDEGVEAEHISFISTRSLASEAQAFTMLLSGRGWQLLRSERTASRQHAHVIEVQKGAQLAVINLQHRRQGDTAIVVVWRKA